MQRSKKESLFDHLVGGYKQGLGDREAELLRSFEIDDNLEFSRKQNRYIAWLLTFKYSTSVASTLSIAVNGAWGIAHRATVRGKFAIIDRWYRMLCGKCDYLVAPVS